MSTTFVNIQTPESGIVKDGLVYWFVPSNSNTYPGTGTKVYDLSGTNGDSDIINTPTYNGKTFVLSNGSNQNIELPNLSLNYPLNISFVSKEPVTGTNGTCVIFSNPTIESKSIGVTVQKNAAGGIRAFKFDGTFQNALKTIDVEYDRFYYVSANFTSSSIDLYVDGEYDSSLAGPHAKVWTDTDTSYNIGKLNRPSTIYYPGEYGDMQIYNRALSADEIRQNMRALKSKYGMLGLTIHDAFTGSGSLAGRTPDTVDNGDTWATYNSETYSISSGAFNAINDSSDFSKTADLDINTTKYRLVAIVQPSSSSLWRCGLTFAITNTADGSETFAKFDASSGVRFVEYDGGVASVYVKGSVATYSTYMLILDVDGSDVNYEVKTSDGVTSLLSGSHTISVPTSTRVGINSVDANGKVLDFKVYA